MALQQFQLSLAVFLAFAGFCCAQPSPAPTSFRSESGIEGLVSLAPAHPGPVRPGMQSSVPMAGATFVVMSAAGAAADFTTDAQGEFKVFLPPGHYSVTKKEPQKIGRCGPFEVDVVAGQMTKVEWRCDSGMR
jgi:hypothetical protein